MVLSHKLEINGNDVTEWLILQTRFAPTITDRIPDASFQIDVACPYAINYGDDVYYYLKIDSYVKMFGGKIVNKLTDDDNFYYNCTAKGFAFQAYETKYTGRFRYDLGSGNMKYIILAIIAEKFPEWTYDDTSIPDIAIEFTVKNFINQYPSDILNNFAKQANRIWYVDENKKFWFITPTYTTVSSNIQKGVNIVGNIFRDIDDSNFGNIFKVFGKSFNVDIEDTFTTGGTTQEFQLSQFPSSSTSVSYSTGTTVSTALEGVADYNNGTVYDAYFKPDVPSLKFNINTFAASTLKVKYQVSSQISEELINAASIAKYKFEKVKEIIDDNITTQEDAYEICKNDYDTNSDVITIYNVNVFPQTQQQLEDWRVGKSVRLILDDVDSYFDILASTIIISKMAPPTVTLTLNNAPKSLNSRVYTLMQRISRNEINDYGTGQAFVKTLYWGDNVCFSVDNISCDTQDADDGTFILQDPDLTPPPDDRSLMVDDGYTGDSIGETPAYVNGATYTTDKSGRNNYAMSFNGSSHYLLASPFPTLVAPYTINMWISINAVTAGQQSLIDLSGANTYPVIDLRNNGKFLIYCGSEKYRYSTKTISTPDYNTWMMLTFVVGSSNTTDMHIYYNGSLNDGTTGANTGTYYEPNTELQIARAHATNYFGGKMSHIAIFNKALNASEVTELYNAGNVYDYPLSSNLRTNLVNHYSLRTPAVMRDDFTTARVMMMSKNESNIYQERFIDDWFIDSASSNGTLDRDNKTYTIPAGGTLQSREIAKDSTQFSNIIFTALYTGSTPKIEICNDSVGFSTGTLGSTFTFGTAGDGIKYRMINQSANPIVLSYVKGVYS